MKHVHAIAVAIAATVVLSTPVFAQKVTSAETIRAVALQSGLSERKVRMLVGNRSGFAEYRATYQRSQEKLIRAIGQDNYQRLLSGEAIELPQPGAASHVAAADEEE
jgi:hypothetical protein